MVTAIDRFKIWASKEGQGIFIPDAISNEERIELLRQIDRNKKLFVNQYEEILHITVHASIEEFDKFLKYYGEF